MKDEGQGDDVERHVRVAEVRNHEGTDAVDADSAVARRRSWGVGKDHRSGNSQPAAAAYAGTQRGVEGGRTCAGTQALCGSCRTTRADQWQTAGISGHCQHGI